MVIYSDGKHLLGFVLSNHVLVKELLHLLWLQKIDIGSIYRSLRLRTELILKFLVDDLSTDIYALVADVCTVRSCNELANLGLELTTKRATNLIVFYCHNNLL